MQQIPKPLAVINDETLMDKRLPKRSFCIETLLPEGISMLGGALKIGKSWMVLDIGVRVAKGESIWSLPTKRGTVLYLALEDSLARIQERLCKLTDDVPGNLFFAIAAGTLADEIIKLAQFVKSIEQFKGGNTEFAEQFCAYASVEISAKALKQLMNRWRYQLEERFVYFKSSRSNGQRFLEIRYIPSSIVNDNTQTMPSGDDEEISTNEGRFLAVGTADRDESAVEDGSSAVCDLCVRPFLAFLWKARLQHERAYYSRLMPWQAERVAFRQTHKKRVYPQPLRRSRNSFCKAKRISQRHLCRYITLPQGNISHLARRDISLTLRRPK